MSTQHRFLTNEEWFNHFQDTLTLEVRERFESLLNTYVDDHEYNRLEIRRLGVEVDDAWDQVISLEHDLRAANKKIDELQQKLGELEKSE